MAQEEKSFVDEIAEKYGFNVVRREGVVMLCRGQIIYEDFHTEEELADFLREIVQK